MFVNSFFPLVLQMKPEVEVFFNDPSDIIKKSLKQLIEVRFTLIT